MTDTRLEAIQQNIPYIEVYETERKNIFKVRIDLETLTPVLIFPSKVLINFYDKIKEYYQCQAIEFIPNNFKSALFDDRKLSKRRKLLDQLDCGGVLIDSDEGEQFFQIADSFIEIDYVKKEYCETLVNELLISAKEYHTQFLSPYLGLVNIFESYSDKLISIRDFGMAFDPGSAYTIEIKDYEKKQEVIFALANSIPFEQVIKMKDAYIELHKKFGHKKTVDITVEDGWNEFLLYKAKREF